MKREVVLGSRSLSHSSPVPNRPCGLCGRKTPRKKFRHAKASMATTKRNRYGGGEGPASAKQLMFRQVALSTFLENKVTVCNC